MTDNPMAFAVNELADQRDALRRERDEARVEVETMAEEAANWRRSALYAQNEVERLRADNERLLKACLGLQDDIEALQQQRAELILKIERLRAALRGIADNPDPVDSQRCYCRWSKNVAREALGSANETSGG